MITGGGDGDRAEASVQVFTELVQLGRPLCFNMVDIVIINQQVDNVHFLPQPRKQIAEI